VADYPLGLMTPEFATRRIIQELESLEKIELNPNLTTNSHDVLKRFAKSGHGATFMTTYHPEIQSGELTALKIDHPILASLEACLIKRVGRPLSAAANE